MIEQHIIQDDIATGYSLLRRVLFKSSANHDIPELKLSVAKFCFDGKHLASYRQYCGLSVKRFPLTYLFVASQSAQLHLLSHRQFPLKTLGLLHKSISFFQYESIAEQQEFDVSLQIGAAVKHSRGIEFELQVRFEQDSQLIAGFDSQYFCLTNKSQASKQPDPKQIYRDFTTVAELNFTERNVRGYAKASGDYNPIHLHKITALPFGFNKPIAHGMYLLIRSMQALDLNPQSIEVQFKRPALLPVSTTLTVRDQLGVLLNSTQKPILTFSWQD